MDPSRPGPSTAPNVAVNYDTDEDDPEARDHFQRVVDDDSDDSEVSYLSEDDPDIGTEAPQWSISTAGLRPITFVKEEILLVPIPGEGNPLDFFRLLVDDVFLEDIVKRTNEKARDIFFTKPDLNPHSRINAWKDLTVPEFLTFLGLLLHTGTIRLNRLADYWKTDKLFRLFAFRNVMSRDRFQNILRCLYFQSTNSQEKSSMDKITSVVNYFNDKMFQIYYPERTLSLDEAMVLWRGRLYFRQYIKGKRHKYGVKLYSLCEHSVLILTFHVYGGSSDPLVGGKNHTEKVVMYLMKEKLGNGHSLFMDNFYNSYSLSAKLLSKMTYSTGTLRLNRKHVPDDVKSTVLKKGETIARYGEGIMIGKWKDKRVVTYISSQYENEMVDFLTKRRTIKKKPMPIVQYNSYMSGVDRADQLLSYYPCDRKTLFWYKKIFIHVLQMLLLNSHNLHNKYMRKMSFYDFRLKVISGLLPQLVDAPVESPAQKRLRENVHVIAKIEKEGLGRRGRKKCRECYKNKTQRLTHYYCKTCPDKPGLCIGKCFDEFHK